MKDRYKIKTKLQNGHPQTKINRNGVPLLKEQLEDELKKPYRLIKMFHDSIVKNSRLGEITSSFKD